MTALFTTREEHADRLVNIALADLDRKLRLLHRRRADLAPEHVHHLRRHLLATAVWEIEGAEAFRHERCRTCAGRGRELVDVPRFGDLPGEHPRVEGGPCPDCLGSGKLR